jgi:hypothetical protein
MTLERWVNLEHDGAKFGSCLFTCVNHVDPDFFVSQESSHTKKLTRDVTWPGRLTPIRVAIVELMVNAPGVFSIPSLGETQFQRDEGTESLLKTESAFEMSIPRSGMHRNPSSEYCMIWKYVTQLFAVP